MKNARRNLALAAVAAASLALAPSALADVRIHMNLPLPPLPHKVLRHLPPLPPPPVVHVERYGGYRDGRWNYANRHRDDRYVSRYARYDRSRYAWVEGRWVLRPYYGAMWVDGAYDPWGRWLPGYWIRTR